VTGANERLKEDNASGGSASARAHLGRRVYEFFVPPRETPPVRVGFNLAVEAIVASVVFAALVGAPLEAWFVLPALVAPVAFLGGVIRHKYMR
jgi:hypothetical protein